MLVQEMLFGRRHSGEGFAAHSALVILEGSMESTGRLLFGRRAEMVVLSLGFDVVGSHVVVPQAIKSVFVHDGGAGLLFRHPVGVHLPFLVEFVAHGVRDGQLAQSRLRLGC